jgi:hypothetical protein
MSFIRQMPQNFYLTFPLMRINSGMRGMATPKPAPALPYVLQHSHIITLYKNTDRYIV